MPRPHINGQTAASVETRVAAALTDTEITSDDLATLLDELEDAISNIEAEAEEKRRTAFDPIAMPDANAARASVEITAFAVQRLRNLHPRLEQHYRTSRNKEEATAWNTEADAVAATVQQLADEARNVYPELALRLADLFKRIANVDAEVNKINHAAPSNVRRRVHCDPQLTAIAKELKLPDFSDPNGRLLLWPVATTPLAVLIAQSMSPAVHSGGEWWKDGTAKAAESRREQQRVAEYYERQQREVDERQAAEAAALNERDEQQRAERYGRR
jgi:hypothetical protein